MNSEKKFPKEPSDTESIRNYIMEKGKYATRSILELIEIFFFLELSTFSPISKSRGEGLL
jgi:hypothetical protein